VKLVTKNLKRTNKIMIIAMELSLNQKNVGTFLAVFAIILILLLSFVKTDVDKRDVILCQAFHDSNMDMTTCPAHQSNTSWFIVVSFVISFLILGSGLLLFFLPFKKKEELKIDVSKLDEDEHKIYDLLKLHDGSMYQSDLIKETEYSKVKITRILDKLEGKKVIDRKRRGMTNIIILK